jgi:hypothetical protein
VTCNRMMPVEAQGGSSSSGQHGREVTDAKKQGRSAVEPGTRKQSPGQLRWQRRPKRGRRWCSGDGNVDGGAAVDFGSLTA